MSAQSLRQTLEGWASSNRGSIASGLTKWRLVVEQHNSSWFKFICCQGKCKGAPSSAPDVVSGHQLLYDVQSDPFDMHDLSLEYPEVVAKMRQHLPDSFNCGGALDYIV